MINRMKMGIFLYLCLYITNLEAISSSNVDQFNKPSVNYYFKEAFEKPKGSRDANKAQLVKVFLPIKGKKIEQFDINRGEDGTFYLVAKTADRKLWRWDERKGIWLSTGTGDIIRVTSNGEVWATGGSGGLSKWKVGYFDEGKDNESWELIHGKITRDQIHAMSNYLPANNQVLTVLDFDVHHGADGKLYLMVQASNKRGYRWHEGDQKWLDSGSITRNNSISRRGDVWAADGNKFWYWKQGIAFEERNTRYAGSSYVYPWAQGSEWENNGVLHAEGKKRQVRHVAINGLGDDLFVTAATTDDTTWRRSLNDPNNWQRMGAGGIVTPNVTHEGECWHLGAGALWWWVDGRLFTPGNTHYMHDERDRKTGITFHKNWKANTMDSCVVTFKARARSNITVAFSSKPDNVEDGMYTVIIGGDDNKKCFVRKGNIATDNALIVDSANVTNANVTGGLPGAGFTWDSYWISFDKGVITVGKGEQVGANQFLQWEDSSHLMGLSYIGFGGHHSSFVEFADIQIRGKEKSEPAEPASESQNVVAQSQIAQQAVEGQQQAKREKRKKKKKKAKRKKKKGKKAKKAKKKSKKKKKAKKKGKKKGNKKKGNKTKKGKKKAKKKGKKAKSKKKGKKAKKAKRKKAKKGKKAAKAE